MTAPRVDQRGAIAAVDDFCAHRRPLNFRSLPSQENFMARE
jgi:hypothetical protein